MSRGVFMALVFEPFQGRVLCKRSPFCCLVESVMLYVVQVAATERRVLSTIESRQCDA